MRYLYRCIFTAFFTITLYISATGQSRIENELILQLRSTSDIDNVIYSLRRRDILAGKIKKKELSRPPYNFWKISLDRNIYPDILNKIIENENVVKVQYNHKFSYRNTPDDSLFYRQWSLNNTGQGGGQNDADIDADLAWDLTTGGISPSGDTIVICVIDNGIDTSHVDLVDNIWKNTKEIRGNGKDDDGNGYIDDYLGWNTYINTDDIEGGGHGTPVSGIIGAKGNNKIGISGVNWDIKLMVVVNGDDEASIIGAYLYALKMRKLYNETNGEKGAFVVATNASFGIDNAKAEDHPIWCSIYDSLGVAGILNIGATSNNNVNVDTKGDMPSSCPSDYLLTVTNVDKYGQKVNSAGYGTKTIDLGAFGKSTFSTQNNSRYGSFGGTSAATPHATGVAGLLYSYSNKLDQISHNNPSKAALMVKDAMMKGTVHNTSMEGISVSEGVLNAYGALRDMEKYNGDCAPPVEVEIDSTGGDQITFSWSDYDPDLKYNLIYKDENGTFQLIENIISPYTLSGLSYCTDYTLQLQTVCDSVAGEPGFSFNIKTLGCCESPKLTAYNIENGNLHLEWEKKLAAKQYLLISRYWSFPEYDTFYVQNNEYDIEYDFDCGVYDLQIKSECDDDYSDHASRYLLGNDCDNCNKIDYCYPFIDNDFEWIENIDFAGFNFKSGKNKNGFAYFKSMPSCTMFAGKSYNVYADFVFDNAVYNDYFYAWIDFDRNGYFDSTEMIINIRTDKKYNINESITIPDTIEPGVTAIRFMLNGYPVKDVCDMNSSIYGEYEDYCIFLDTLQCGSELINMNFEGIDTSIEFISWNNPYDYKYFDIGIKQSDIFSDFKYLGIRKDTFITISNLNKCTNYDLLLKSYCEPYKNTGLYFNFKTNCESANENISLNNLKIYPNPVKDVLILDLENSVVNAKVEIYDTFGKLVFYKKYKMMSREEIDISKIVLSGVYFMKIENGNMSRTVKIIKY